MTFNYGGTVLGTAALDTNGNATFFTQSLPVGTHTVTATYAGTTNVAASTSGNFIETITSTVTVRDS